MLTGFEPAERIPVFSVLTAIVMDEEQAAHKFLCAWLVMLLLLIGMVLSFVLITDPYRLYRWIEKPGFNLKKPGLDRFQVDIKLAHAKHAMADVIILGNSRAEIGFDPLSPMLQAQGKSVYNLAIPGTTLETSIGELQELIGSEHMPRQIVLGLDFLDFIQLNNAKTAIFGNASGTKPEIRSELWQFNALFSMASIRDGFRTLYIQYDDEAQSLTSEGFNPLREYIKLTREEGYYAVFKQKESQYAQRFSRATGRLSDTAILQVDTVLSMAGHSGIELKIVVYPYHAQIMALLTSAGLSALFEDWKRQVAMRIDANKRKYPNAVFSFLDFSGFGDFQCERIPDKKVPAATTRWYWEAGHFKKALGDRILTQLFRPNETSSQIEGFGVELDLTTLAQNSVRLDTERAACESGYPELFIEANAAIRRAQR